MPTVPISLKRLAEIKEALIVLRQSSLPLRVRRMRERLLQREADHILLLEKSTPPIPGMCTRCQEEPFVSNAIHCYSCITYYLDVIPRWVRAGVMSQDEGDGFMAGLMKTLLDNKLIGVPNGENELG